ncbi:putative FCP1 homology domain-containing protein [Smittium mucronatum]|uniref:Mitochondrial import inner membrane translocase subunit TIM50 n=1 Tax=Smittium mucronatum TaxID=133383 RepID=A0A1R0H4A6_9FUNG|nr:putative FCP1 homology domain-containing protein [Smittium mucronatum]
MSTRPGLSHFLNFAFKNFAVMVWSSAQPQNVLKMVRLGFGSHYNELAGIWDRRYCNLSGYYFSKCQSIKDLSRIWSSWSILDSEHSWLYRNTEFSPYYNSPLLDSHPAQSKNLIVSSNTNTPQFDSSESSLAQDFEKIPVSKQIDSHNQIISTPNEIISNVQINSSDNKNQRDQKPSCLFKPSNSTVFVENPDSHSISPAKNYPLSLNKATKSLSTTENSFVSTISESSRISINHFSDTPSNISCTVAPNYFNSLHINVIQKDIEHKAYSPISPMINPSNKKRPRSEDFLPYPDKTIFENELKLKKAKNIDISDSGDFQNKAHAIENDIIKDPDSLNPIKDLEFPAPPKVSSKWNIKNTILIDDSAEKAANQPNNHICVYPYSIEFFDRDYELEYLEYYLTDLLRSSISPDFDVSDYISKNPYKDFCDKYDPFCQ